MEGDAGTRQLNPTDADQAPDESLAVSRPQTEEAAEPTDDRRPARLGRGWVATICAGLLLLAAAGGVTGYLALKANQQSAETAREKATALKAARDCVAATHSLAACSAASSERASAAARSLARSAR